MRFGLEHRVMWYVKFSKENIVSIFKVEGDLCDTVYETFDILWYFHSTLISDKEMATFSFNATNGLDVCLFVRLRRVQFAVMYAFQIT